MLFAFNDSCWFLEKLSIISFPIAVKKLSRMQTVFVSSRTIKASDTLKHQPTVWYEHPGSGSHGQVLARSCAGVRVSLAFIVVVKQLFIFCHFFSARRSSRCGTFKAT